MQPPLAARRDQPIAGEHLQNLIPPCLSFGSGGNDRPEPIELKLLPQLPVSQQAPHCRGRRSCISKGEAEQPTIARDRFAAILGNSQLPERRHPRRTSIALRHATGARVDRAEIQNVPAAHPPVTKALVLDHVP